jgi:hypothetical protein
MIKRYNAAIATLLKTSTFYTLCSIYTILNQIQRAISSFKNWFVIQLANNPNCTEHEAPAIAFTTLSYINRFQSTSS